MSDHLARARAVHLERVRARERHAVRSLAWCIALFGGACVSASIVLWESKIDGDVRDALGARAWVAQGGVIALGVVTALAALVTHAADPGVAQPSARDDDGAACVARLDDAIAEAVERETNASNAVDSYSDRIRASIERVVADDAEASALGMDKLYDGTWTKRGDDGHEEHRIKWCGTCKLWRPRNSTHCATCDVCVRRFDHHCGIVGNCIGEYNHRWFLVLLSSGACFGLLIFLVAAYSLACMSNREWRDSAYPYMLLACTLAGFHVLGLLGFAWSHLVIFSIDVTTKQYVQKARGESILDVRRRALTHDSCYKRCCHVPLRLKSTAMREFRARRREAGSDAAV